VRWSTLPQRAEQGNTTHSMAELLLLLLLLRIITACRPQWSTAVMGHNTCVDGCPYGSGQKQKSAL